MNNETYWRVTDSIIRAIDSGTPPWRKPWTPGSDAAPAMQRPLRVTGQPYTGINTLVLWGAAQAKGYTSRYWLTYKAATEMGAQVRKGERSELAFFVGTFQPKDAKPAGADSNDSDNCDDDDAPSRKFLRAYNVFNADQIDGLPAKYLGAQSVIMPEPETGRIASADTFIADTGALIRHGGNQAYYRPSADSIQLPAFGQFVTPHAYYATAFHELAHWTGAPHRLNREKGLRFGDDRYAAEELVAELAAAFTCADQSIPNATEQTAAYIKSWLKTLQNDNRAIFKAAALAESAARYLREPAPAPAPTTPEPVTTGDKPAPRAARRGATVAPAAPLNMPRASVLREPEPIAEPEPVREPEPVAEPVASKPEPVASIVARVVARVAFWRRKPVTVAEPVAAPEPVREPEPVAEPKPVAEPEPVKPRRAWRPEPVAEPEPIESATYIRAGHGFHAGAAMMDFARWPTDLPIQLTPHEHAPPRSSIGYVAGVPASSLAFMRGQRVRVMVSKSGLRTIVPPASKPEPVREPEPVRKPEPVAEHAPVTLADYPASFHRDYETAFASNLRLRVTNAENCARAIGIAKARACLELGTRRWALIPGASVVVTLPARLANMKLHRRVARLSPTQRIPVAKYWPGGNLPVALADSAFVADASNGAILTDAQRAAFVRDYAARNPVAEPEPVAKPVHKPEPVRKPVASKPARKPEPVARKPESADTELTYLRAMLPASWSADRCRHPSVKGCTLWVFGDDGKQIGAISRETAERDWLVHAINRGLPISQAKVVTLTAAFEHIRQQITRLAETVRKPEPVASKPARKPARLNGAASH